MKVNDRMHLNNIESVLYKSKSITNQEHSQQKTREYVEISDEGRNALKDAYSKAIDVLREIRFASIQAKIKKLPIDYTLKENLFKLKLRVSSTNGKENKFEPYSECQYKVFDQWIDENLYGHITDDEIKEIKEKVKAATTPMDEVNAEEGYRGTSFESVLFTNAGVFALENVKENLLPESMRRGFQSLIDEYEYFNDKSHENIMKRMTPNYIVVDIGSPNQKYKYKDEIIKGEVSFYKKEKTYIKNKLLELSSKNTAIEDIHNYISDFYENRHDYKNNKKALYSKIDNIMRNLSELLN